MGGVGRSSAGADSVMLGDLHLKKFAEQGKQGNLGQPEEVLGCLGMELLVVCELWWSYTYSSQGECRQRLEEASGGQQHER